MKTIIGLDRVIMSWQGEAIQEARGVGADQVLVPLTIRAALVNMAGMMQMGGKDGFVLEDTAKALIAASNGTVELENHPFELLSQAVEENNCRYNTMIRNAVAKVIEDAKAAPMYSEANK